VPIERAPLLPIAAAFAAGIVAAEWVHVAPALLLELTAGILLLACLTFGRRHDRTTLVLLLAGAGTLGMLRAGPPPLPRDHIARLALPPIAAIEGRLREEPVRWTAERTRILLDVDAYEEGPDRRAALGRVQLTIYGETPALGEGQRIRVLARLHRPVGFRDPGVFDYEAALRRDGIALVGSGRGDRVTALTRDTPPWPVRVRRWALATIHAQLPEASASLLAGLLLGERTSLPVETDEAFRRAGVYHVLAVSGFNVALVASSVFAILSLVGIPRRGTALAAGAVLVGFALVVGGQPSVLRATVMGLLLLAAVLLERDSQLVNALCLAGLALLIWTPEDLWDPGFQLSFAATAGIVYLSPPFTRVLVERGSPRWLAAPVAVSLAAQLPVTPIMLAHFNQLSLIGVAANLLVVPLAGPATTLGMLALLVHLASPDAASLLFDVLWLVLVALRGAVWVAAAVPGAMVHLPAPWWATTVAWYGALLLLPHVLVRSWARPTAAALLATVLMLSLWPWVDPGDGRLRITFLDVGQGDATFVEIPAGPRLLIDGGPAGPRRLDVGERVLAPFLWNRAVGGVDVVALSHADADHAGGLATVLRRFRIGEFWETGRWGPGGEETRRAVAESGVARRVLAAGQRIWIGDAVVTVVNPDDRPNVSPNDDSLVLRLDWRTVSILLTGDLGEVGEARMLERSAPGPILVLRVGHHGSRFSSSPPFLESTRPAFAVISVGMHNPFRHPHPETLARIEASGARTYRTDQDGAVVMETDGDRLWITRWARRTTEVFDLRPERPTREGPASPSTAS
jgi:competence protein ComEC